jgi:signal transduction histidine kinase
MGWRSISGAASPIAVLPEARDRLNETLVHELQAPVKAVQWLAEAVRASAGTLPPEELRRQMDSILRSMQYMGSLIDQLSADHRNGNGRPSLEPRTVDLGNLVRETVDDLSAVLGPHPLSVTAPRGLKAMVDPVRIRQLLVNLLVNAARFGEAGSPITIEVRDGGGEVVITVADRCEGIRPPDRLRIFERYVRLRKAAGGIGLGLYVARGIARAHGGDLGVSSGDDGGCRFQLRLPRAS